MRVSFLTSAALLAASALLSAQQFKNPNNLGPEHADALSRSWS